MHELREIEAKYYTGLIGQFITHLNVVGSLKYPIGQFKTHFLVVSSE